VFLKTTNLGFETQFYIRARQYKAAQSPQTNKFNVSKPEQAMLDNKGQGVHV